MKKKEKAGPVDFTMEYNVCCINCDQVFQPAPRSSLWWQAKQYADSGKLDALHISGEKCGCVAKPSKLELPYQVISTGFSGSFYESFASFIPAVKFALAETQRGAIVAILGVSEAVAEHIEYGI